MIEVNLVAADISKKSGILLDKFERQQATHEILALANLSDINLIQKDLNIGDFPLLSLRCISSVLKVSSNKAKYDNEQLNPEYSLKRVGITSITCNEINLFITGVSLKDGKFSSAWINSVSRFLGGRDFDEYDLPLLNEHKSSCLAAYRILESAGVGIEIIQRNSGVLIPFPCKSPESGSGTSRALPGVLMLPTGVPDLMYAECWLHECLHTELLLAEWATGEELAKCDQNLVTPWRTINRSANLLLHGCFVFVHLVTFMQKMLESYRMIPTEWEISAAKGKRILICDIDEVISFRISQVQDAMSTLNRYATLSKLGQRAVEAINKKLSEFN